MSRWLLFLGVLAAVLLGAFLWVPSRRPPSLLLISIDTLRADHLATYGYSRNTAPFLAELAHRGTVFESVSVPLAATDASHASLLSSQHPLRHRLLMLAVPLLENVETMAQVLRRQGYATAGAVSVFHLGSDYGFQRGFDRFSGSWAKTAPFPERRDADATNRDVFRMIDEYLARDRRSPFFLFVHYYDVHGPYAHDWPGSPGMPANSLTEAVDRYDGGIRYVDDHIRSLLAHLQQRDLTSHLLVVVTADHGEELGEHGSLARHVDFYRETARVPLIVAGPGVPVRRVARPISSMDIAVSLLRLAGARFRGPVDGREIPELTDGRGEKPDPRSEPWEAADRPFLVLGHPPYTRSRLLQSGRWSYIRNLDFFYEHAVFFGPGRQPRHFDRSQLAPLEAARRDGEISVYRLPGLFCGIDSPDSGWGAADAAAVTVEVLRRPRCDVSLQVVAAPGVSYFDNPVLLGDSGLVQFGAGRADGTELSISPSRCVESVRAATTPFSGSEVEHPGLEIGSTVTTALFHRLLTLRKYEPGDEIYDLSRDPNMRDNLAFRPGLQARVDEFELQQRRLFARLSGGRGLGEGSASYTPEEVRRLRSLGYLQ